MEIIPAILAKTESELRDKLAAVPGAAAWVHIDFTNSSISPSVEGEYPIRPRRTGGGGGFGENTTTPSPFGRHPSSTEEGMFLEAHLMLFNPRALIDDLVRAGFSRVIVQAEDVSPESFADLLHEWRAAVEVVPSLEIETPLGAIDSFAHELASIQLMGIAEIGAQGQPFDPRVISRVSALHAKYPHLTIAVDGGVNKKNSERLISAGAGRLVVGSRLADFYTKDTPPLPSP